MNSKLLAKRTFIQASIVTLVVLLAWMLVNTGEIILTVFAGVLIAILFSGSARWLAHKTGFSTKIWLPITVIIPFLLFGLFFSYTASKLATQANELTERLPQAVSYVEQQVSKFELADQLTKKMKTLREYEPKAGTVFNAVSNIFKSTASVLGSLIFALFLGLFLSINPSWYINGAVSMVPPSHRGRIREVLDSCGTAILGWLIAKISSMLIVGVLTTLGLWVLGIELALILGIIAALLSFIPNLGPIIAFIPAALVSIMSGFNALFYVAILYIAVQTLESYLITPMLQAKIADLPPALILIAQVMLGGMVGLMGVLLAAPLMVVLIVVVNMLYVQDILNSEGATED